MPIQYRHEWKHEITWADLLAIRARLRAVAQPDPHAIDGKYLIRSLYFDNLDDKTLREKLNGVNMREKFRIRYYNGDTSFIQLEKKSRLNGVGTKFSAPMTAEEVQKVIDGDIEWMRASPHSLIQELYCKMRYQQLRPKTIVDYTRQPFIYGPGNVRVTFDYNIRTSITSVLGRLAYNYQEKYFASASYRRDASSRFAKKNGKWWGDFWSVGAAWAMHKEPWFQVDWVNNLKLKLSIGQQGNDNVGSYYYTDLYTLSKASDTQMSPSFALLGNPDLTWETTTNFNVGVEFGILNNLVSGSLDVYNKKISDMLFWISLPESVGTRGYYGNIGDMRNRGFELTLTVNPIRTHDVNWTITGSIAHNTTKILKLPAQKTMDYGGYVDNGTGNDCWYAVGGPLYNAFLVKYAGVNDQGQALYYVDTTVPEGKRTSYPSQLQDATTTDWNKAGRYTTGSLLPKATGGFSTSVSAYGFDASVSFDYQIGGKIYDTRYAMLMTPVVSKGNGQNFSTDILKSWTPNNTSSNIPRFWFGDKYTSETSTRFLTRASYLNFQSFTLGYTLPKRLLRLTPLSSVRFYVAGENLCFWSARKGLDPRYSYARNESVNVYSPVRNVSGGIQVTF